MKLYDFALAPNPRRVRIFLAEKGIEPEVEQVAIREGAQFEPAFLAINPNATVPVLQLDDGTTIADSFAICRYAEEIQPDPPLMGRTPFEKATICYWQRRIELEGFQAVAEILRNSAERFRDHALPGPLPVAQIPDLVTRGRDRLPAFFEMLDTRLSESAFVAGADYSAADIDALVAVDFAANAAQERPPERFSALKAWHGRVSARPSAGA
ncbi:MAG TPA: glutathione S-transferase family protein [Kiloniellaceae bacterium]|nr:glutathione S-transferase family protein [Kiloniellaceae bacterium]